MFRTGMILRCCCHCILNNIEAHVRKLQGLKRIGRKRPSNPGLAFSLITHFINEGFNHIVDYIV